MLKELLERYPQLSACKEDIEAVRDMMIACYEQGGKILLCGNGGSCADCDHIVGELTKGFLKLRPIGEERKQSMKEANPLLTDDVLSKLQEALPAVSLPSMTAVNSAFCNDVDPELLYAQTVMALGKKNDMLIGISTSGNAKNVSAAMNVAKGLEMTTVGLTGIGGGKLKEIADRCICAPEKETYKVQELHLPIYHYLCVEVEGHFFEN